MSVITEWYPSLNGKGVPFARQAIYRDRFKFVIEGDGEREFLYDLDQSPYEEFDIRSRQSELAGSMRAELEAILQRSRVGVTDAPAVMDPAVKEQLRALGYAN